MFRSSAQAVQLRRGGLQGQRLLPNRQPRLGQEFGERQRGEVLEFGILGILGILGCGLVGFGRVESRKFNAGHDRLQFLQFRQLAGGYPQPARRRHSAAVLRPYRGGMADSLNPTPLDRVWRVLRPDFLRTTAARRIAAGVLVLLAGASAVRPDPADLHREVVIAVRDLSPGITLTADDITLRKHPAALLPDGAQTGPASLIGATLAGPARRGEVLTDARVLGSRLAGLSAGPDARVVPLQLADTAVLNLLRAGDIVDVLGAPGPTSDTRPRVVANDAVVVLVSPGSTALGSGDDRVVLVALPAPAATALAAATLVQTVTLTIH